MNERFSIKFVTSYVSHTDIFVNGITNSADMTSLFESDHCSSFLIFFLLSLKICDAVAQQGPVLPLLQ